MSQAEVDRVCDYRCIPRVKVGSRCSVDGRMGTIVGGNSSCNFDVVMDGQEYASNCHPFWRFKIFDDNGEIIFHGLGHQKD